VNALALVALAGETRPRMILILFALLGAPLWGQAPPSHRNFERDLGVSCEHCHEAEKWTDASKPAFDRTRRMFAMVREINHAPMPALAEVNCWTCHRGKTKPATIPRASWEAISAKWPEGLPENRRLGMSVYSASLGVGCDHCHVGEDWKNPGKTAFATTHVMLDMMSGMPKHFSETKPPRFQCFSCHQGSRKPQLKP